MTFNIATTREQEENTERDATSNTALPVDQLLRILRTTPVVRAFYVQLSEEKFVDPHRKQGDPYYDYNQSKYLAKDKRISPEELLQRMDRYLERWSMNGVCV